MAQRRHMQHPNIRGRLKTNVLTASLALVATSGAVGIGLATATDSDVPLAMQGIPGMSTQTLIARDSVVSPGAMVGTMRTAMGGPLAAGKGTLPAVNDTRKKVSKKKLIANASERRWATADLNLYRQPEGDASVGELAEGKPVKLSGRNTKERVEIVYKKQLYWVTAGYLSAEKPRPVPKGLSNKPCGDSSVEEGITDDAVLVYRSVCNSFPEITRYIGWDGHGEHSSGRALDIMTSDVELGTAIAEYLRSHASELNLYAVIWRQRIWTPERASEGWRDMPDRGSATANHYDHVHVSVN